MSDLSQHGEWLSLIDVSGPFLAEPVLKQVFPQGLEQIDPLNRKAVRQAYEEWREAIELDDPQLPAFQKAWVELVLKRVLELDEDDEEDILKPRAKLSDALTHLIPEHGVTLRPDFAVVDEQDNDRPLMLIQVFSHDVNLDEPVKGDGWATSPAERMVALCRAYDVRLGLLTNGEQWMLIDAPVGAVTTFASWYARLWGQEPITLQAFVNLLGIRRFFVDPSEQLPALFDESLKLQDEVTDALGEQVRRAVEVLIQRLDRADVDLNRELLVGVEPSELYEAALTVMMRIVFLLSAEERGLLLLGDERYEANYAVSTLRMQLRSDSEEILERRQDAWSRLLSIFRAVYGGIQHETMRLPALGGSLFGPDRFPFLEGRAKGSNWKVDPAMPLPIDNRTVLLLLDAVQLFQGRTLSYRALDVEQIGYVYEGLLERTVVRAKEVTLDLDTSKKSKKPWVTLDELEAAAEEGDQALAALLEERSGSYAGRVKNDLSKKVDEAVADKLLTACHGDQVLRDSIKPYFHFLRMDSWGYPLVYPENTFMVTTGTDRRETGTHYTPKSLTETIVKETLEPVVYVGPVEGNPREEWALKIPAKLLDLKICDPAMGSGAFLVQACQWLSERLVEAWEEAEKQGNAVTSEGLVVEKVNGYEPLRNNAEERLLTARRLIAERCLYGVDINPLAVELAKLSIWLVTLAKGRPFGFLDHNFRSGDSLLGIHDLEQLHYLDMRPGKGSSKKLFAQKIDKAVDAAIALRSELRTRPIRDIRDVEVMASLDEQARQVLELPELIADALVGVVLTANGRHIDTTPLSIEAGEALKEDNSKESVLRKRARKGLKADLAEGRSPRRAFHWPLEFPEVFDRSFSGFDAIVGNPPFVGGKRISANFGDSYLNWLSTQWPKSSKNVDLSGYFHYLASSLLNSGGHYGLISTDRIFSGDSKTHCMDVLAREAGRFTNIKRQVKWPGSANVLVSLIFFSKGESVAQDELSWEPQKLKANAGKSFVGCAVQGSGFILEDTDSSLKRKYSDRTVIRPFLNASDFNGNPKGEPSRDIIFFTDMTLDEAEKYPECLSILRDRVKPYRDTVKRKAHREKWWQFGDWRPGLYHLLEHQERALVVALTTKYFAFMFVDANYVFDQTTVVFPEAGIRDFSILSSSIHQVWAMEYRSNMGETPRYISSRCYESFPYPGSLDGLDGVGKNFYDVRSKYMEKRNFGLTKFYNDFHDPECNDPSIEECRNLQKKIDVAVLAGFEIDDIDLDINFHQVGYLHANKNTRFTMSEDARQKILTRLLSLNKERHLTEQSANKSKPAMKSRVQQSSVAGAEDQSSKKPQPQTDLFEARAASRQSVPETATTVEQVYEWIEEMRGAWVPKKAILSGTGVDGDALDNAIAELIADDDLEQQGEGEDARYRVRG